MCTCSPSPNPCGLKDDPLVLAGDFNTKPEVRQCMVWGGCWGENYGGVRSSLCFFETSRCSFFRFANQSSFFPKFVDAVSTKLVPKGRELATAGEVTHQGPGSPVVSSQMLHSPKLTAFKFLKKVGLSAPISEISSEPTIDFQGFFLSFRKGNLVVFPSGGCFTIHQQHPQRKGGVVALKGAVSTSYPKRVELFLLNTMSPNNPLTPKRLLVFPHKKSNKPMIHINHPRTIWLMFLSNFATLEVVWCIHPTNLSSHLTTPRREKAMITHQPPPPPVQLAVPRTPNCDCCKLVNLIPRTTLAICGVFSTRWPCLTETFCGHLTWFGRLMLHGLSLFSQEHRKTLLYIWSNFWL